MPFIGKTPETGAFRLIDSITTSATDTYALTVEGEHYFPESARNLIVSLNGVTQAPEAAYTVSGSHIVFASALTSSDVIDYILVIGEAVDIGTPSDNTVGNAQLKSSLDLSGKTLTFSADQVSGDAIDGGTISNFSSTGIDDNANDTAITIDANENVGIKGAATYSLTVEDSLGFYGATGVGTVSAMPANDLHILARSGQGIALFTNGTNRRMTINDSGQIGVNTSDPSRQFHARSTQQVVGHFESTSSTRAVITVSDANTSADSYVGLAARGDHLELRSGNNAKVTVRDDGHTGFGTGDPASHSTNGGLTVAASNATGAEFIAYRDDGGLVDGDFCGGYIIGNADGSGAAPHYGGMWATADNIYGYMNLNFGAKRDSYETNTPDVVIDGGGKVGIGTSPLNLLTLKSGSQYQGLAIHNGSGGLIGELVGFASGNDAGGLKLWSGGSAKVQILSNGSSYLTGGNVGIGTTNPSPAYPLDVSGSVRRGDGHTIYQTGGGAVVWYKLFERHFRSSTAFGFDTAEVLILGGGQTSGVSYGSRLVITHKQQGLSDNFNIYQYENLNMTNCIAYTYDANGGNANHGLLTVWVKQPAVYVTVGAFVRRLMPSDTDNYGVYSLISTGSSTQPSGSVLITASSSP